MDVFCGDRSRVQACIIRSAKSRKHAALVQVLERLCACEVAPSNSDGLDLSSFMMVFLELFNRAYYKRPAVSAAATQSVTRPGRTLQRLTRCRPQQLLYWYASCTFIVP